MGVHRESVERKTWVVVSATCDECGADIPVEGDFGHQGMDLGISGNYGSQWDFPIGGFHAVLCEKCGKRLLSLFPTIAKQLEEL